MRVLSNRRHKDNIQTEQQQIRSKIEKEILELQRTVHAQGHEIEELENRHEKELDGIFRDLLSVIDAFDKAENRLSELFPDNEAVNKARKRFATAKNKLLEILSRNGVNEIQFEDGMATIDDCQIEDTEPDPAKPNDTIVSIEKAGYRRNGRLLRLAEVIVVKN